MDFSSAAFIDFFIISFKFCFSNSYIAFCVTPPGEVTFFLKFWGESVEAIAKLAEPEIIEAIKLILSSVERSRFWDDSSKDSIK